VAVLDGPYLTRRLIVARQWLHRATGT